MRIRKPSPAYQEKAHKAYCLLVDFLKSHQKEIETPVWIGAMIGALAEVCEESEISFDVFKKEMEKCVEFYRY